MLQSRLFSYPDTHRRAFPPTLFDIRRPLTKLVDRLGVNYQQLPVNAPIVPVANFQRDGLMAMQNQVRWRPLHEVMPP